MSGIVRTFSQGWDKFKLSTKSFLGAEPSLVDTNDYKKDFSDDPVAKWGTNNKFPIDLDEKVAKCDVVEAVLQDLTSFAFQDDVVAYEKKIVNNEMVYTPIIYDELETLRQNCDMDAYLEKAFYDFFRYGNAWAQPILNEQRSKFTGIYGIDAPHCRNQKKDPATKLSEYVYVSGQWGILPTIRKKLEKALEPHVELVKTITHMDDVETIKARKELKYMMHIMDYSPGNVYYGEAPWHSLLRNEWLDVNGNIPIKLNAFYETALQLNYQIESDYQWLWESLHGQGTWGSAPVEDKTAFINDLHNSIDSNLKGSDKSYTAIFSEFKHVKGEDARSAIKIKVLEKFTKESLIPDAQQSISEIMLAMRYDPSLINSGMFGSKLGAGSGSDKDQGFKLLDIRMHLVRKKILKPIQFMMNYNNPSRNNIVISFPRKEMTTSEVNQKSKNTAPKWN